MTAAAVLREATSCGVAVSLNGDSLALKATSKPSPALLEKLREHKAEILTLLRMEIAAEAAPPPSATVSTDTRASVDRLIADMAAETERRRDWHKQPLQDWRAGRLEIRSALTGEATIIWLRKGKRA
jgi:hypothetical protein